MGPCYKASVMDKLVYLEGAVYRVDENIRFRDPRTIGLLLFRGNIVKRISNNCTSQLVIHGRLTVR